MAQSPQSPESKGVLVVAAHPDDETIGCGGILGGTLQARVVYLTDGVPSDCSLRPTAFREDAERYRQTRANESRRALALVGIGEGRIFSLGGVDQETSFGMVPLAVQLLAILEEVRPSVVITHPYEGGHPDHDTAAFVVRAACTLYRQRHAWNPRLVEMTSYHAPTGQLVTGRFLNDRQGDTCRRDTVTVVLSVDERRCKELMMQCFETQKDVLAPFGIESESFRRAPLYDFSRAPHDGALYYEQLGWRLTGARWRALAMDAARHLFGFI
jgi:LmbE family N-acetylglucosaminyl deacetylase